VNWPWCEPGEPQAATGSKQAAVAIRERAERHAASVAPISDFTSLARLNRVADAVERADEYEAKPAQNPEQLAGKPAYLGQAEAGGLA
jgi:hypothetical protein